MRERGEGGLATPLGLTTQTGWGPGTLNRIYPAEIWRERGIVRVETKDLKKKKSALGSSQDFEDMGRFGKH